MGSVVWWVLGLLGVGAGVAYVVSRSTGKPVAVPHACVADLPAERLAAVDAAIAAKDGALLRSYASQARAQGWTCAADELLVSAAAVEERVASAPPPLPPPPPDRRVRSCKEAIKALPDGLRGLAETAVEEGTSEALNYAATVIALVSAAYSDAVQCLRDLAAVAPTYVPTYGSAELGADATGGGIGS